MKKYNAILISIIPLLLCLITYLIIAEEENILGGNKLNDFLYAYKVKDADETLAGVNIQNDKIYFLLLKENNEYVLHEKDIYSNKNKIIQKFQQENSYCNLIDNYIQCTDNKKITLYDFSMKEIYQVAITTQEDYPKIVPYKDIFIKIENGKLYIAQNKKEQILRELPTEFKDTFVENYYYTKDNTYLLLYNLKEEKYYVYDVNKKKYNIIKSKNSNVYKNGFYFYDKEKYIVVNITKNETKEYKNTYQFDFQYPSILSNDNKSLYMFDISDNKIHIINLENNTITKTELKEQVTKFYVKNNYLFIECAEESNFLYLIDLSKVDGEAIKIEDEINKQDEIITKNITEIKNKYNVNIKIKDETNINFPDFNAEIETNNDQILEAVSKITKILDKYTIEVFNSFYDEINKGLNIYLVSSLTPKNTEEQISNPAAYSLNYQNEYMIVIDINEPNIEELICHEIMHNIELVLTHDTETPFGEWEKLNPDEFKYNNSYTAPYEYDYTLNENDKDNVYFIDEYSHTYETEDRARIFENICACNDSSIINNYPNLIQKGKYLEEELYKYYPSLKETNLFQSMKNT